MTKSSLSASQPAPSTTSRRERRLVRYCTAASAGAAAFTGALTTADASIVFVNYNGQVVTDQVPGDNAFFATGFDLNGDSTTDFSLAVLNGRPSGGAAAAIAGAGGGIVGSASGAYTYAFKLAPGYTIGSAAPFRASGSMAFYNGYANSQWLNSSPGFLGLRFMIGGQTVYGWARVSVAPNAPNSTSARNITIFDAAYETSGAPIVAGAVPEPSTNACIGMLALGAIGLAAHRRRRAALTS